MYDVIIVGAGPAGLFAAYELITKNDKLKVLLLDTEEIFNYFGMDSDVYPTNMEEAKRIEKQVALTGAKLLLVKKEKMRLHMSLQML